ncbi:MAG TPA: rRNA methyltransferase [Acidilobales archaeon]|nr:rRNA methyltransferase [Acidilobales archaeon]
MSVRLVLVEPEGRINFGFILRLCKNFEVYDIYVVNPRFNIDDPEVVEFAAKGSDLIKVVRVVDSLDDALRNVEISLCTSAKSSDEDDVLRHSEPPEILEEVFRRYSKVALVFGRESVGLTRDELRKCTAVITIPGNPEYNVMNISHAVAVILYLTWRYRGVKRRYLPDVKRLDILNKYFEQVLNQLPLDDRYKDKAKIVFNRFIKLYPLRKGEVTTIYRLLKTLLYVLRTARK